MVLDGAGVALLPTFCVAEDIAARRLVRILADYSVPEQPICAYYPHARQQPMKINLFLKFLEARFKTASWGVGL
jgi:DNA-binding transcriptional LysR family regulator